MAQRRTKNKNSVCFRVSVVRSPRSPAPTGDSTRRDGIGVHVLNRFSGGIGSRHEDGGRGDVEQGFPSVGNRRWPGRCGSKTLASEMEAGAKRCRFTQIENLADLSREIHQVGEARSDAARQMAEQRLAQTLLRNRQRSTFPVAKRPTYRPAPWALKLSSKSESTTVTST